MKEDIIGQQIIYFRLVNQSCDKLLRSLKRQAIAALTLLNKKSKKNIKMEIGNTLVEKIK